MSFKSLPLCRQQESTGQLRLPSTPPISFSALGGLASYSSALQGLFMFLLSIIALSSSFSGAQATAQPYSEALGSNYSNPCFHSKKKSLAATEFLLAGCWHKLRIASSCSEPPTVIRPKAGGLFFLLCHAPFKHLFTLLSVTLPFCLHRSFPTKEASPSALEG